MVNVDLLERTLSHISDFPELHNQTGFYEVNEFGVAACFAARALLLAGYTAAFAFYEIGDTTSLAQHPVTKHLVPAWYEAQEVLGLSKEQAANLFRSSNTRQMIELKVKDLINGSPLERYSDLLVSG